MLAQYDVWRAQDDHISLDELGISFDEDKLILNVKGNLGELWAAAQAFPDLLGWQP